MKRRSVGAVVAALLAVQGCAVAPAGPSTIVLAGARKSTAQFDADQTACRRQAQAQVAPAVDLANQQAVVAAAAGTVVGAAIGALVGYGAYGSYGHYAGQSAVWGAGAGLAYGGAVGSGTSQAANVGLQQRYDAAYAQCMVALGNQLPSTWRPSALPPPPPGYQAPPVAPRPPLPPAVPPPDTPPPVGVFAPA